jgi:mannose-1-phosphate guanylyltransferase/mannose-6-phosphate isomerase
VNVFALDPKEKDEYFFKLGYANFQENNNVAARAAFSEMKDGSSTYAVERFVEIPPLAQAQEMLLSGKYLWNAGIFLCQASVLLMLYQACPDILKSCQEAMKASVVDGDFIRPDKESFLACRSESIDYAVMERFEKVAVVPFKGAWSDVGSWNAVAALSPADESGNRISGLGVASHAHNTYINAPHRPVVALGTSDLLIVDTPDAVLVASSDRVEQVKDVVAKLKDGATQAVNRVAGPGDGRLYRYGCFQ